MELDEEVSKFKEWILKMFITVIALSIIFNACSVINKKLGLKQDNVYEESAEALIDYHFGVDLDLTPSSFEN